MFTKILIANRGEIACRVIKTARRLGIRTVAMYSAADATARHVRLADKTVLIGPAAVRESYLSASRILEAAQKTGLTPDQLGAALVLILHRLAEQSRPKSRIFRRLHRRPQ